SKVDDMEMDEVVDRNYSHEEIKDLEQKYFELEADNKRISNELANEFSKVRDSYRVRFDEKLVAENEKLKDKNKEYKKTLSTLRSEKEVLANQLAELVVENKKLKDKISTSSKNKLKEQSKYDRLATDIKVRMEKSVNFKKDLTN
ncbi:18366_t:CDS:2, partial [Rhizophagus irregularis]